MFKFLKLAFLSLCLMTAFVSCDRLFNKSEEKTKKEYTTYDVISQRRYEQEEIRVNNIYYDLPESVIIAIVDKLGINTSKHAIVFEYEQNSDYYDGIAEGALNKNRLIPDEELIPEPPMKEKEKPIISGLENI